MWKLVPGDLARINLDGFAVGSLLLSKAPMGVVSSNMSVGEVRSNETLIVIAVTTGCQFTYVLGQRHGWINTKYLKKIKDDAP